MNERGGGTVDFIVAQGALTALLLIIPIAPIVGISNVALGLLALASMAGLGWLLVSSLVWLRSRTVRARTRGVKPTSRNVVATIYTTLKNASTQFGRQPDGTWVLTEE